MKCETSQRDMLLEQSGELPGWRKRRVAAHAAACEACRRYREDALRIADAARDLTADAAPHAFAMERIKQAARDALADAPIERATPWFPAWKPALAVAGAALLLAAGLLFLDRRPAAPAPQTARPAPAAADDQTAIVTAWNGVLDESIAELGEMVATVSAGLTSGGTAAADAGEGDADSIANELLILEDWS